MSLPGRGGRGSDGLESETGLFLSPLLLALTLDESFPGIMGE